MSPRVALAVVKTVVNPARADGRRVASCRMAPGGLYPPPGLSFGSGRLLAVRRLRTPVTDPGARKRHSI